MQSRLYKCVDTYSHTVTDIYIHTKTHIRLHAHLYKFADTKEQFDLDSEFCTFGFDRLCTPIRKE